MRITNSIISHQSLTGMQRNLAAMEEAQRRVTTGLRIEKPSDDPAAAVSVMGTDRQLRGLQQYKRNIDAAQSRLSAEETVLDSVTRVLERAKELGLSQAGSSGSAQTRMLVRNEVDSLLDETVGLGNTRFGGAYLFGGRFSDTAPFTANGTTSATRPPTGAQPVEIDDGRRVTVHHDAFQVFVDTEALAALQDLSNALGANSDSQIAAALTRLDTAHARVQDVYGETGASSAQLTVARANVESLEFTLQNFRADLSEVEMEEAISRLVSRQTAFQAALAATSRMVSLTLSDYLR